MTWAGANDDCEENDDAVDDEGGDENEVEDDGEPFDDKMARLTAELRIQTAESTRLDTLIWANLEDIGYGK